MDTTQNSIAEIIIQNTPAETGCPISHILKFLPPETTKEEIKEVVKILKNYNLAFLSPRFFKSPIVKLGTNGIQLQQSGQSVLSFILDQKRRIEQNKQLAGAFLLGGVVFAVIIWLIFNHK